MTKQEAPQKTMTTTLQPSSQANGTSASLADLIRTLNAEIDKPNGELITARSLTRTLRFLQQSVGFKVASKDQLLPPAAARTIRLLFLTDYNHSRNVLRLLTPPQADTNASMEFSTATTISRDEEAAALTQALIQSLALEIDPPRLQVLSQVFGHGEEQSTTERLLLHIEQTNDEVRRILHEAFRSQDDQLANAFHSLAGSLDQFRVELMEGMMPQTDEALYIYLQSLPFRHFALHYPKHLKATLIQGEIGCIRVDANRICGEPLHASSSHYGPACRNLSVSTVNQYFRDHSDEITYLVNKATGLPTTTRQLQGHLDRIKVLLVSYAHRSLDCTDSEATVLSVYDVVAAFCSFRYQQEEGADYKPYWHGQTDQGKNPQRLFDKGLSEKDPHQHQGVMQIYLNRFYEYQASFQGTIGSYRAWMRYQIAALGAYQSVLELHDIAAISSGLTTLNFYRIAAAEDLVFDHAQADL